MKDIFDEIKNKDILSLIYQFDSTYYNIYNNCIKQMNILNNRIECINELKYCIYKRRIYPYRPTNKNIKVGFLF